MFKTDESIFLLNLHYLFEIKLENLYRIEINKCIQKKENEDSMKFWEFGGTRITLPSKVPVIWIIHACL